MAPKKGSGFLARLLDIDERFTFYGTYHDNFVNKIIHILCVWPILLTALVLLWRTHELPYPQLQAPSDLAIEGIGIKFNAAFYAAVLYFAFYMGLEVKNFAKLTGVGALAALLVVACYLAAGHIHQLGSVFIPNPLEQGKLSGWDVEVDKLAGGVHIFCWLAQFVGHGVFEGRAPALFDNIVQAFFMAPVFVLLEAVFILGLKRDLHDDFQYLVKKAIAKQKEEAKMQNILKASGRVTRSRSKRESM